MLTLRDMADNQKITNYSMVFKIQADTNRYFQLLKCAHICVGYEVPGGGTPCGTICVQYYVDKQ